MNPNDFAELLDGWTRLRVDMYKHDTLSYETIFDSDDWPGWSPCSISSFVNPAIDTFELEVAQVCIDDDHIVLRCVKA